MQLKLFNFSKRRNSTKQPATDYPATTVEVFLKKPTSMSEPTFIISGVNVLSETINYCLWEDRYYFVTDITYLNNDNCEIHCSIDVLATFKNQIGNYTAFVERSASSYDIMVNDELLTGQQQIVNTEGRETNITGLSSTGCYIVRVVGKGGVVTFAMDSLETLSGVYVYEAVFGDGFQWEDLNAITSNISKVIFNPSQYIVSVNWIPVAIENISGTNDTIKIGFWDSGVQALKVSGNGYSNIISLNIPPRYFNDFRDNNPQFTQANLYLSGVGTININPMEIYDGELDLFYAIDYATGAVLYELWNPETDKIIGTYDGQLGVSIQIGNSVVSGNTFTSAVAGLTGIIGGAVGKSVGSIVAGAGATVNAVNNIIAPTPSVNGSMGNRMKFPALPKPRISITNFGSKDFPTTVNGRPLYQNRKLNTLSGYIKCGGASIELNAHSDERDKVNDFLNSGFYYE